MASAKTKNSTRHSTQKASENRESSELRSEIEDLRIGRSADRNGKEEIFIYNSHS
jgi:hypothetical protein